MTPTCCAIGLDVGGTKIAGALVGFPEGVVLRRQLIATDSSEGGRAVLTRLTALARELQAAAHGLNLVGIGCGICEIVDRQGTVRSAATLAWEGLPVREELAAIAPAVLDADVRAAARAEAWFGAGRGCEIFLYVTIGTGISAALVIGGEPFLGARGAPGTIASSPAGVVCEHCGQRIERSLEAFAAGPALVNRYNAASPQPRSTAEAVCAAAAERDHVAMGIVSSAGHAIGAAVGHLVNTVDPERVVIGGGLGLSSGLYWDSLVESARRHSWWPAHREVPIMWAETGMAAGVIGAAVLAWQTFRPGAGSSLKKPC